MKIIDAIKKLRGSPAEIPDCIRSDLAQFFHDMGYRVGAEIGTSRGRFALHLAKNNTKLYCIDPWKDFNGNNDIQEAHYKEAKKTLSSFQNVTLLRKPSMEAVKDFEDESLDFVYIDGNHTFRYVAEDLFEWQKKIRKGGTLCGHDYIHPKRTNRWHNLHVKFVVDAFVECFRIKNWYLLGSTDPKDGDRRDKVRSWMWIKE